VTGGERVTDETDSLRVMAGRKPTCFHRAQRRSMYMRATDYEVFTGACAGCLVGSGRAGRGGCTEMETKTVRRKKNQGGAVLDSRCRGSWAERASKGGYFGGKTGYRGTSSWHVVERRNYANYLSLFHSLERSARYRSLSSSSVSWH
jgi:hypothetical protein